MTCCCSSKTSSNLSLVPIPASLQLTAGEGPVLCSATTVTAEDTAAEFAASQVTDALSKLKLCSCKSCRSSIRFVKSESNPGKDCYTLKNDASGVVITACDANGFFYGAQTLIQMFPASADEVRDGMITLPALEITDAPRFAWRALMVDSCRHYWPMDEMKKIVDYMASMKLNILHWHLTEDQAWRIEIKKYPALTGKGAWRDGVGFELPADSTSHYRADGKYGGFYTQDDCRELVAYAAKRGISVMPEIEIPGHSCAMLNAYPQLGCTGNPVDVPLVGGIFHDITCAGNEEAMKFYEDVLSEVAGIFPFEFVHIGGDEAPKDNWKKCPKCQARMKEVGAQDEEQLQNWVTKRMENHLRSLGKRLIGWDEILEGDNLSKTAGVMVWRAWKENPKPEVHAAQNGHDMVMSPTSHCYFDYKQSDSPDEPRAINSTHFISLEHIYTFEPLLETVPAEKQHLIKGGQANVWTEYIPNEKHLEYMLAPRLSALAEALWSPKDKRDWNDFRSRMEGQIKRLEAAGFNYRKLDPVK